jgi:hypothetical protein
MSHDGTEAVVYEMPAALRALAEADAAAAQGESSPNLFAGAFTYQTLANGMPILNSYPSAPASIFIDFDGGVYHGSFTAEPYDVDGASPTLTLEEQGTIVEACRQMSMYYDMFSVNVTTIEPIEPDDDWTFGGVMIRESTAAGAKNANVVISPNQESYIQWRSSTNGSSSYTAGAAVEAPYWVRLTRNGSTFTGEISPNGTTWTSLGTVIVSMANSVLVGLVASSIDNADLDTVTFDNVTIEASAGAAGAGGLNLALPLIVSPGNESAPASSPLNKVASSNLNLAMGLPTGGNAAGRPVRTIRSEVELPIPPRSKLVSQTTMADSFSMIGRVSIPSSRVSSSRVKIFPNHSDSQIPQSEIANGRQFLNSFN